MHFRTKCALVGILLFIYPNLCGWTADFSIIFAGAPRYCLLGDINRGVNGYLGFWADLSELSGGIVSEDKHSMRFVMNYSVDFTLALDSEYSLVMGVGNLRFQSASEVFINYADTQPDTSALVETRIDAIPIKLSVVKYYSLTRSLNTFLEGGFTAYLARYRSSYWPSGPGDSHIQDAHAIGIGVICAGGLEFKASRYLSLILKAEGDYAKVNSFKGTRNSGGSTIPSEEKGTLYFEELTIYSPPSAERTYPILMIYEDPPQTAVRQARIDFSGFSLFIGMKISF